MDGTRQLIQEIAVYIVAAAFLGLLAGWLLGRGSGARRAELRLRDEIHQELQEELTRERAANAPRTAPPRVVPSPVLVRPDPALFTENERLRDRLVVVNARATEMAAENESMRVVVHELQRRMSSVELQLGVRAPLPSSLPLSPMDGLSSVNGSDISGSIDNGTHELLDRSADSVVPPANGSTDAVVDHTPVLTRGDDLTKLKGVGANEAARLAGAGVRTYADVARLSKDDIDRLSAELGISARRVHRWNWPEAARRLRARP